MHTCACTCVFNLQSSCLLGLCGNAVLLGKRHVQIFIFFFFLIFNRCLTFGLIFLLIPQSGSSWTTQCKFESQTCAWLQILTGFVLPHPWGRSPCYLSMPVGKLSNASLYQGWRLQGASSMQAGDPISNFLWGIGQSLKISHTYVHINA